MISIIGTIIRIIQTTRLAPDRSTRSVNYDRNLQDTSGQQN